MVGGMGEGEEERNVGEVVWRRSNITTLYSWISLLSLSLSYSIPFMDSSLNSNLQNHQGTQTASSELSCERGKRGATLETMLDKRMSATSAGTELSQLDSWIDRHKSRR